MCVDVDAVGYKPEEARPFFISSSESIGSYYEKWKNQPGQILEWSPADDFTFERASSAIDINTLNDWNNRQLEVDDFNYVRTGQVYGRHASGRDDNGNRFYSGIKRNSHRQE